MSKYWECQSGKLLVGVTVNEGGWYVEVPEEAGEEFKLFEVPLYGGEPRFIDGFDNFEDAMETGESMT